MADLQPRSDALWVLGGIGVLGLVAYLAMRTQQGNVLQPTAAQAPAATQPPAMTHDSSGNGIATNTMAYDMTALENPIMQVPASAFGGTPIPAMFVQTPSGSIIPYTPGLSYSLGSIIHYADGTVSLL